MQCLDLEDITAALVGLEDITAALVGLEDIMEDPEDTDRLWAVVCIISLRWAGECGTVRLVAEAAAAACSL